MAGIDDQTQAVRKETMRIKSAGLVVAGAILAVLMFAVPPASASGEIYTPGNTGSAEFQSYGEHFYVHDYASDSHGVVGFLQRWNGSSWVWVTPSTGVYNGNGYAGPPEHRNYEIAEGVPVRYAACLIDGANGTPYSCSGYAVDVA